MLRRWLEIFLPTSASLMATIGPHQMIPFKLNTLSSIILGNIPLYSNFILPCRRRRWSGRRWWRVPWRRASPSSRRPWGRCGGWRSARSRRSAPPRSWCWWPRRAAGASWWARRSGGSGWGWGGGGGARAWRQGGGQGGCCGGHGWGGQHCRAASVSGPAAGGSGAEIQKNIVNY